MMYGQGNNESIITECLDKILDIIDGYIELVESVTRKDKTYEKAN